MYSCLAALESSPVLNVEVKAIISLLVLNSLRVSEVLKIKSNDISSSGLILIKASKNSFDKYVRDMSYLEFWLMFRRENRCLGDFYNRYYIYRVMRHYGFCFRFEGSTKNSVTHCSRHLNSIDVKNVTNNNDSVTLLLGHKSKNNAKYYVRNEQKK
jgi:integrase